MSRPATQESDSVSRSLAASFEDWDSGNANPSLPRPAKNISTSRTLHMQLQMAAKTIQTHNRGRHCRNLTTREQVSDIALQSRSDEMGK